MIVGDKSCVKCDKYHCRRLNNWFFFSIIQDILFSKFPLRDTMEGTSVILSQLRKDLIKTNGRYHETNNYSDELSIGFNSNNHETANNRTDTVTEQRNESDQNNQIPNRYLDLDNNNNSNNSRDIGGTGEVTKRLSHWFSSLWVSSGDNNNNTNDKGDSGIGQGSVDNYVNQDDSNNNTNNKDENKDNSIWLLSKQYESSEEIESLYEVTNYYSTPGSFPHLPMQSSQTTMSFSNCNSEFYQDFTSKIWCTYRHNYPAIKSTNFTHDGGWGCMLRSGQSLLSNALILHFLGRG